MFHDNYALYQDLSAKLTTVQIWGSGHRRFVYRKIITRMSKHQSSTLTCVTNYVSWLYKHSAFPSLSNKKKNLDQKFWPATNITTHRFKEVQVAQKHTSPQASANIRVYCCQTHTLCIADRSLFNSLLVTDGSSPKNGSSQSINKN